MHVLQLVGHDKHFPVVISEYYEFEHSLTQVVPSKNVGVYPLISQDVQLYEFYVQVKHIDEHSKHSIFTE